MRDSLEGKARCVVLDTSVLYSRPAVYELDEIRALRPVRLVVPATVVSELDVLAQRIHNRDRAKAALNVLRTLVDRGGAIDDVSCGEMMTIRILGADQEHAEAAALDFSIADDRILACAIRLASGDNDVALASTEFALCLKAELHGIRGLYMERLADRRVDATRRDIAALDDAWRRLQASRDALEVCRRAIAFVNTKLVHRVASGDGAEPFVRDTVQNFVGLSRAWTSGVSLNDVIKEYLSLAPPPEIDQRVATIYEPPTNVLEWSPAANYRRNETAEERVLRIKRDEEAKRSADEYIIDHVLNWLGVVRDAVLDEVEEN